jgi:ribosome-associated translation inhibitor RaiA
MEGKNLLSGGIEQLNEIKECLLERYGYQSNNETLLVEEEALEKGIAEMELSIREEIQKTTKRRRQEIEAAFDEQEDKLQTRIKRIREKRERSKNAKVSQRIDAETASLRQENAQLRLEAKTLFKQKHIPAFCNTKLYYSLYSPSCFTDILVILAALILILLAIPCGIYFLLLPDGPLPYLILTYVLTVVFFGGLYLLIGNRTKEKHTTEIQQVKGLRGQIRVNKRKIAVIKRNIRRDRDESTYGLQDFDTELAKLEQERKEVASQKKEALTTFDQSTTLIIASEIEANYNNKLAAKREEYEKARAASAKAEEKIKALTIKLASEYEPFLGKEFMTLKQVDSLINIIQAGNASNISEAIAYFKLNTVNDEDAESK